MEKQVKTEQPLNRSVRFRGCLTDATNHIQALDRFLGLILDGVPGFRSLGRGTLLAIVGIRWI